LVHAARALAREKNVQVPYRLTLEARGIGHAIRNPQGTDLQEEIKPLPEVIDKASTDGAAQNGAAGIEYGLTELDEVFRQRCVGAKGCVTVTTAIANLQRNARARGHGGQDAKRSGDDLGPDPLSRQNANHQRLARRW
jgi:hypothetical protein